MHDPLATRDAREVSIDAKRLAEGRDRPLVRGGGDEETGRRWLQEHIEDMRRRMNEATKGERS